MRSYRQPLATEGNALARFSRFSRVGHVGRRRPPSLALTRVRPRNWRRRHEAAAERTIETTSRRLDTSIRSFVSRVDALDPLCMGNLLGRRRSLRDALSSALPMRKWSRDRLVEQSSADSEYADLAPCADRVLYLRRRLRERTQRVRNSPTSGVARRGRDVVSRRNSLISGTRCRARSGAAAARSA